MKKMKKICLLISCIICTLPAISCSDKPAAKEPANSKAEQSKDQKPNDTQIKTEPDSDAKSDISTITECEAGHFGMKCEPCTCQYGGCNDGRLGDGKCHDCDDDAFGWNCQFICDCNENQLCDDGLNGLGCICKNHFVGENCDKEIKCVHGILDSQTGHCRSGYCQEGWAGEDCDKTISCVNGLVDPQNGHCIKNSCAPQFAGEDCNECRADGPADAFTDTRDNKVYDTAIVNCQRWMADNLAYKGNNITCYTVKNYDYYGCYYSFDDAQKVCPSGWHLATIQEIGELALYVNQKSCPLAQWAEGDNCNSTGFNAIRSGYYSGNILFSAQYTAFYWIDNPVESSFAAIDSTSIAAFKSSFYNITDAPVRCVMDYSCGKHETWYDSFGCYCDKHFTGDNCDSCAEPFTGPECDSCIKPWFGPECDRCPRNRGGENCDSCAEGFSGENCENWTGSTEVTGGVTYKTTKIGDRIWMAENLAATKAADGRPVTCYAATMIDPDFTAHYGCLYTREDALKVCPTGWRLPNYEDFLALDDYITKYAPELRSTSWDNGSDKYGFGAIPANYLIKSDGYFDYFSETNYSAMYWASDYDEDTKKGLCLDISSSNRISLSPCLPTEGLFVRCIKN